MLKRCPREAVGNWDVFHHIKFGFGGSVLKTYQVVISRCLLNGPPSCVDLGGYQPEPG